MQHQLDESGLAVLANLLPENRALITPGAEWLAVVDGRPRDGQKCLLIMPDGENLLCTYEHTSPPVFRSISSHYWCYSYDAIWISII